MINRKLRVAREQRRWTMAVAAEKIGVTEQTYSSWENGKRIPHLSTLDLLCQAFDDLSPEELGFRGLDQAPEQEKSSVTPPSVSQPPKLDQPTSGITLLTGEQVAALVSLLGGNMKQFDPAKRATLEQLLKILEGASSIGLVSVLQNLVQTGNLLHHEELVSISTTNIPILWRLYFDGHLSELEHVLPDYLSPLSALAEQPSLYQKQAASLASKVHQLACMVTLQPQDYNSALVHADQAIQYARVAEDLNLLVASLIRKALVYFYLNRPSQRLWAYQEAAQYNKSISPLLQGRVYMGLAEAHSALTNFDSAHENEALQFLDLMYKTFPNQPKEDPNFNYTHFSLPRRYEGLIYLNLNQPTRAWDTLAQIDKDIPTLIVPDRVELSVNQAKALVATDNLEQSKTYLESAVISAKALGSRLRYRESYDIYQRMQEKWPNEQQVKDLADLFH